MDSLFLEIFGCEDAKAPVEKAATALPWDSPLYPYSESSGTASALVQRTQADGLAEEVLGPRETVFITAAKDGTPADELLSLNLDFAKAWTQGQRTLDRIREAAPDRQRQIRLLVSQARRAAPATIRDCDSWDDLQVACVKFIEAAILSA